MSKFVRLHDGRAVEVLTTEGDPADLFHPELTWVLVDAATADEAFINAIYRDGAFWPPPPTQPVESGATLESLRAQLEALSAFLATMTPTDSAFP